MSDLEVLSIGFPWTGLIGRVKGFAPRDLVSPLLVKAVNLISEFWIIQ